MANVDPRVAAAQRVAATKTPYQRMVDHALGRQAQGAQDAQLIPAKPVPPITDSELASGYAASMGDIDGKIQAAMAQGDMASVQRLQAMKSSLEAKKQALSTAASSREALERAHAIADPMPPSADLIARKFLSSPRSSQTEGERQQMRRSRQARGEMQDKPGLVPLVDEGGPSAFPLKTTRSARPDMPDAVLNPPVMQQDPVPADAFGSLDEFFAALKARE
jgi:hypothetical protein